jgi:MoxR-like ATPase
LTRRRQRGQDEITLAPQTSASELLQMRELVEQVYVAPDIERYMVNLVAATRRHNQVVVGASPRGSLALLKLSRAWAAMQNRDFVLPDDVKRFARPALGHRLILDPELWLRRGATENVMEVVLRTVPVPVLDGLPTVDDE